MAVTELEPGPPGRGDPGRQPLWKLMIRNSLTPQPAKPAGAGFVGYWTQLLDNFGAVCSLAFESAVVTVAGLLHRRFAYREFLEQAWMLVSVTFLPTILIAVPFGTVIILEAGGIANQVGATSFTGAVDALFTVREVAPIVTALILSGAGGSAICSDLGARTIRDEIAALEVMGISVAERLVAPRILAGVVVAMFLNGVVAFAGLLSGYASDIYILHGTSGAYLQAFSSFSQAADLAESTFKAGVFGFVAVIVASYKGLQAKRGPVGVGQAVNQAVVLTGLALFMLDLIFTDVFLTVTPPRIP